MQYDLRKDEREYDDNEREEDELLEAGDGSFD